MDLLDSAAGEVGLGFWLFAALVLGLVIGSFLNVVILRLPVMMMRSWRRESRQILEIQGEEAEPERFNLVEPASTCPSCGHRIRAWENVPLLSFVVLRGRCASCRTRISLRYPATELACGLLTAALVLRFGAEPVTLAAMGLTWALIVLTAVDFEHQLLPDNITQPLLWAGLIVNSQHLLVPFADAFWGAVAGYLVLWSVYWGFKLLTGKEGMGYGDFKLLAALGAWLGWQALPAIVLMSSVVGATLGLAMIALRGRDSSQPMPFGPFLAIAGWIVLVWGDRLNALYLDVLGV
jgi:leader peptidase (prepilin peptidase)/N-methyltransferase